MLLAVSLATIFIAAGLLGRRRGDDRRDVRLMLGTGAGFGGAVLLALAVQSS